MEFYGPNTNNEQYKHLQSLKDYIAIVGTDNAFEEMRYWELGQSLQDPLIQKIWLPLHREILCALLEILLNRSDAGHTVKDRVELEILRALTRTPGSERATSVERYSR